MFKKFISFLFVVVLTLVILHFIPKELKLAAKDKAFATISKIIPPSVKKKIEPVIYTPVEQRTKLLAKLGTNIELLKNSFSPSSVSNKKSLSDTASSSNSESASSLLTLPPEKLTTEQIIKTLEESQKLIDEIDKKNADQTVLNKITTSIFQKITNPTSTAECVSN